MASITLLLTLVSIASDTSAGLPPEPLGTIQGVVVDGTKQDAPLEGIDVVLRAGSSRELLPVAETKSDRYGKFFFRQAPLDPQIVYLPGANRDGVHYPGQRVHLDANNRFAHVKLVAYSAVHTPNPLVAERHEFDILVEGKALKVTETLALRNPTQATYVGESMGPGPPVTFWLSIPQDFDRVTFDKEFFGRRFLVVDHRPVTDLPWMPGTRELRYTYHIPLAENGGKFHRPLDVPTSEICVRLRGTNTNQVSCNLPVVDTGEEQLVYGSSGEGLPESFELELEIGTLPFPWMEYGRWGALLVLVVLAAATAAIYHLRCRRAQSFHGRVNERPAQRRAA